MVGRGCFESDDRSFDAKAGVDGEWSNGLTLELQVKIFKHPRKDVLESGEGAFLKWFMDWPNEDEARPRGPPDAAALAVLLANTAPGCFSGEKGGEGVSVGPFVEVGDMAGDDVAFADANALGEGQTRGGETRGGAPGGTRGGPIVEPTPNGRNFGKTNSTCNGNDRNRKLSF